MGNAIFKYDNRYIVVAGQEVRGDVDLDECQELILNDGDATYCSLYGGRVEVRRGAEMFIDDIQIKHFSPSGNISGLEIQIDDEFDLEQIAAFLNQIENLGVDPFLQNYKANLQALKNEIETMAANLQQELSIEEDEFKSKSLKCLRRTMLELSCILFLLLINMNAGLSNQDYTNAYDAIINMYY